VRVTDGIADADEEIAMRARTSLGWAALVPSGQVKVSVVSRWVTLSGQLEWHFQRAAAETIVRDLAGVAGVSNEITLRARPQTTNLKSHIERALRRSADLDARFYPRQGRRWFGDPGGRGGVVARPGTRQRRGVDGTGRERGP